MYIILLHIVSLHSLGFIVTKFACRFRLHFSTGGAYVLTFFIWCEGRGLKIYISSANIESRAEPLQKKNLWKAGGSNTSRRRIDPKICLVISRPRVKRGDLGLLVKFTREEPSGACSQCTCGDECNCTSCKRKRETTLTVKARQAELPHILQLQPVTTYFLACFSPSKRLSECTSTGVHTHRSAHFLDQILGLQVHAVSDDVHRLHMHACYPVIIHHSYVW